MRTLPIAVAFFIFLEVAMLSFAQNFAGPHISPLILLLSGLICSLLFIRFATKRAFTAHPTNPKISNFLIASILLVSLSFVFAQYITPELNKFPFTNPHTVSGSDVIPQMQVLVQRLLAGEYPYRTITPDDWGFEHPLFPTYLPLTWMPFVIAEYTHLDYRWLAFLFLTGASLYLLSMFSSLSLFRVLLLALAPVIFLFLFAEQRPYIFSLSVETLIAAYYLCLAASLLTRSTIATGVFLMFCLLSRYSVVLWVPLILIVMWKNEKISRVVILCSIILGGFLAFYAIPYLIDDPTIFKQGYDYHTEGAVHRWYPRDWQAPGATPDNLLQGLGLGIYFYEGFDLDVAGKVRMYRLAHLILSILVVVGLSIYFLRKHKSLDHRLFLLGSLKVYLVVFYNFVQLPFHYLYLVPVFVSLPMLGVLLSPVKPTASIPQEAP